MKTERKIDTLVPAGILKTFTPLRGLMLQTEIPLDNKIIMPDNIKWPNAPLGMPPGYQQSILEGNPKVAGQFTFRAIIPPNWKAMPHFHTADEHITVLKGSCFLGLGEKYDENSATQLPTNAFSVMKAGTIHYFFTKEACIIQVHGVGPQKIIYFNPSDDPRNQ